jgi:hypothetical protein
MRKPFADGTYYALVDSTGDYYINGYINASKGFCIITGEIKKDKATSVWATIKKANMLLDMGYGVISSRINTFTDYRLIFDNKNKLIQSIFEAIQ